MLLLEQGVEGTPDPKHSSRNETPGSVSLTGPVDENTAESKGSRKGLLVLLSSALLQAKEAAGGCWSDQQVYTGILVTLNIAWAQSLDVHQGHQELHW